MEKYNAIGQPCVRIQISQDGTKLVWTDGSEKSEQHFELGSSKAYPACSTHEEVFEGTVREVVDKFVREGSNAALCAYGQTGSGKTFMMRGAGGAADGRGGLVHLAIRHLFAAAARPGREVRVSSFQVDQDGVGDLLQPGGPQLRLFDHAERGTVVRDLRSEPVASAEAAVAVFERSWEGRAVASTGANDKSSRSHAFFRVELTDLLLGTRTLDLVDLAGSENAKVTEGLSPRSRKKRLDEGAAINESLCALRRLVLQLKQGESGTFREQALTRLLKGALTSNSATCVLACVKPEPEAAPETKNTISFLRDVTSLRVAARGAAAPSGATSAQLETLRVALGEAEAGAEAARAERDAALREAQEAARLEAALRAELEAARREAAAREEALRGELAAAEAREASAHRAVSVRHAAPPRRTTRAWADAAARGQLARREAEHARAEAEQAATSAGEIAAKLARATADLAARPRPGPAARLRPSR
eukprot:tig00000851_g4901.t1